MEILRIYIQAANSAFISLKDSLCLLLLMLITVAGQNMSLEITEFSASKVKFSCRYDYDGNMTDVFFDVSNDQYLCMQQNIEWCKVTTLKHKCSYFQCGYGRDSKTFPFFVKLDAGTCDTSMYVKCQVRHLISQPEMVKQIKLEAQSDPPVISVNDGQPVEASCNPFQIACTVTNMCYKNTLEISGNLYQENDKIEHIHTRQGDRFTTTAISTAIFKEAKNYTIFCKETGKDGVYKKSFTLEVVPNKNITCEKNDENDLLLSLAAAGFIPMSAILLVSIIFNISVLVLLCQRKRSKRLKRGAQRNQCNGNVEEGYQLLPIESSSPSDSIICGFWAEQDEKVGRKISNFIKSRQKGMEVHKVDLDDTSFLQKSRYYIGYYAVISAQSLKNQNFVLHITTILRRLALCIMHSRSTFVLVGDSADFDLLIDQLKTSRPIDMRTVQMVNAFQRLDTDHLEQIVSKLEGPPLNHEMSPFAGNIGVGLAWSSFYKTYAYIFNEMKTRIEKSKAVKKYKERMSRYYIIVIPESSEVSNNLQEGLSSLSDMGQLDDGVQIEPAWYQHSVSTERVYKITNTKGDAYYCCQGHVTIPSSLKKIISSGELKAEENSKQFTLFMATMESILQHPHCADGVLIYNCSDVSKLADNICRLIEAPEAPVIRHIDPMNQVTAVAEGLARSFYHRRLTKLGPRLAQWIKSSRYYQQKLLPMAFFIILPYSCKCFSKLSDAKEEHIQFTRMLRPDERRNQIPMYKISTGLETYYACAEYCSEIQVLQDMVSKWQLGFTDMHIAAELRVLYEMLLYLLTRPSAPDYCSIFRLVYYNDSDSSGKKLSEFLVEEIKQSLRDEN